MTSKSSQKGKGLFVISHPCPDFSRIQVLGSFLFSNCGFTLYATSRVREKKSRVRIHYLREIKHEMKGRN